MKKILSILLTMALTLSLASCANAPAASSSSSPPAGDEPSAEASQPETGAAAEKEPITFTMFVDHSWFWMDKWGTEPTSLEITKQTGVSFDVTRTSDEQQLALLIAADDLPDIVYTATTSTAALLADPNLCYSYNELVEKTGVDIYASEEVISNNTAADGNYYALLNAYTSQEALDEGNTLLGGGVTSIAYRTDIYEAIGSPQLKTLADLENALLKSKEMYPDVVPLLNDVGRLDYFQGQLGINGGVIGYNAAGKPCYRLNLDGIKDYFALLNRFAREGLISAEAQTYTFDRYSEVRNSGGSFMQIRSADEAITPNNAARQSGTGYSWKLLTNELDEKAIPSLTTGIGWSGTYISKKCKDPDRAIEFMSWARSEEGRKLCSWGIQGEHWDYNEKGETVTTEAYQAGIAAGKQKQLDFGVAAWIFGDQGDEAAFIDHAITDPDQLDYTARLQSAVKSAKVMSELYFATPTSGDELTIYNSLNDMYKSESLKVIFAESDAEYQAALDNMYAQAEQIGMSKLETWMQEALAARTA